MISKIKKLLFIIFPFIENYSANKKIKHIQEKFHDQLSKIDKSDAISTNILKEYYLDTLRVKDKFEDKAKANVIAVTISITLIMGASDFLNSVYSKFVCNFPSWILWVLCVLFLLAVIYMIIAGVLSIRVLMDDNIIYTISLKSYTLDDDDLRQEYDICAEANINQNRIRNNEVFTSYKCIRNSLICLFIVAVIVALPLR